jgi:hypothetical protein
MLEIKWEWAALFGLLLLLLCYVAYQRHCWMSDNGEDEERRGGR